MKRRIHILIINQHGENRGDEAAQRGMLEGIASELGETRFTMICQYRDRRLNIPFDQEVITLPMLIPLTEFCTGLLYILLRHLKLDLKFFLGAQAKEIINAYLSADLIISAPGGPYLGDMYSGIFSTHELAHWFMIYLGFFFKKKLFLYAPSAGPFKNKWMNPLRRFLYRKFSCLTTRENISKQYLEHLLPGSKVILTADAAIQRQIPPMKKTRFLQKHPRCPEDAFIVSISANDYKYPLSRDPKQKKQQYKKCMADVLAHIARKKENAYFLLFPQLYGSIHSDIGFLEKMGKTLPDNIEWEIVDPDFTSDQQQQLFGITDLCIASRYHPQIFAACQSIPLIGICYEHKQFGFMKALEMEEFAFDIYNMNATSMIAAVDTAFDQHSELAQRLSQNIVSLIKKSRRTSELVGQTLRNKSS